MVALTVAIILVGMTTSIYNVFRKNITVQQNMAGLAQNARVVIDRLSRELRQSPVLVTNFPADSTDNSVTQPNQVEFEDGHAGDLSYRRYYISGTILKLETKEYYFPAAPTVRVQWSATNVAAGLQSRVLSTVDVADQVASIVGYDGGGVLNLTVTTTDGVNQNYPLRVTIQLRNLL